MAARPVSPTAKAAASTQGDQDVQGIGNTIPPPSAKALTGKKGAQQRKTAQRLQVHSANSTPLRRSARLLQRTNPAITVLGTVELTTLKPAQEAESSTSSSKSEPAPKRQQLAAASATTPVDYDKIWLYRTAHWVEHSTLPNIQQEQEMDRLRKLQQEAPPKRKPTAPPHPKRPRLDAGAESDSTPSVKPSNPTSPIISDLLRDLKSAPYRHPRYVGQLRERGSFMRECNEGITSDSTQLCQTLLQARFDPPKDTLFSDTGLLKRTMERLECENETRVIRDISQLIVPSAEILADRGAKHLEICKETTNARWNNCIPFHGPLPQPDFSLGFDREAFGEERLRKLGPFIGNEIKDSTYIAATYNMYFPFLTSEVKCGLSALDIADRQNAHSQTVALRNLFQLFRLVGRENELHRQIKGFSFAHNNDNVRVYGHYILIVNGEAKYYRHPITQFSILPTDDSDHRWKAYNIVLKLYEFWVPEHFKFICSAIDDLPSKLNFEPSTIQSGTQIADEEIPALRLALSQEPESQPGDI